jgi:antitoxin (DNA-binding transcriptional repressor) of toxin-antitoxin stability system
MVKEGERIELTERGRPIAMVTAIPDDESPFDRLVREGHVTRATGSLLKFLEENPPLPPTEGVPLPSEILAAIRADER